MVPKESDAITFDIYIAGFECRIKQICKEFCEQWKTCVSVIPDIDYIYDSGREPGVIVRIINYAKRPATKSELKNMAFQLCEKLIKEAGQRSASVVGPDKSYYFGVEEVDHPRT